MSRRSYASASFALIWAMSVTGVFLFAPGCSQPEAKPVITVNNMRFDPDEPTIYQKAIPLSAENYDTLLSSPPYLDPGMTLRHVMAMIGDDVKNFERTLYKRNIPGERDGQYNSLLHYAALNPNIEIAQFLLDKAADVRAENFRKETPLDWAAMRNPNVEVVRLLLDAENAVSEISPQRMYQLLRRAAEWNTNPDVLRFLLEWSDEAKLFNDSQLVQMAEPLFILAVRRNPNPEILRILVDMGADPNPETNNLMRMPLRLAATYNPNPAVLDMLIELGAEFDPKHPENRVRRNAYEMFFIAVRANPSVEVSKWFVARGLDPHLRDGNDYSACLYGIRNYRSPETVRFYFGLLEENGIDDEMRHHLFTYTSYPPDLAELLLDKYLDREKVHGAPMSAFVPFCGYNGKPLWDRLIEYGADPHAENELGLTMSDVASAYQYEGLSLYLERLGVEPRQLLWFKTREVRIISVTLPEQDRVVWERLLDRVSVGYRENAGVFSESHYPRSYICATTERSGEILRNAARPSLMHVPTNPFLLQLAELQSQLGFYEDAVVTVLQIKHTSLPPGKTAEDIRENGYGHAPDDATQESEIYARDMMLGKLVTRLLGNQQSQRAARAANLIYATPERDNALMQVLNAQCYAMTYGNYPGKYDEMQTKAMQTLACLSDARKSTGYEILAQEAAKKQDVARMTLFLERIGTANMDEAWLRSLARSALRQFPPISYEQDKPGFDKKLEIILAVAPNHLVKAEVLSDTLYMKYTRGRDEKLGAESQEAFVKDVDTIANLVADLPVNDRKIALFSELLRICRHSEIPPDRIVADLRSAFEELRNMPDDAPGKSRMMANACFQLCGEEQLPPAERLAMFDTAVDFAIERYLRFPADDSTKNNDDSVMALQTLSRIALYPKRYGFDVALTESFIGRLCDRLPKETRPTLTRFASATYDIDDPDVVEVLRRRPALPKDRFDLLYQYGTHNDPELLMQLAEDIPDLWERMQAFGRFAQAAGHRSDSLDLRRRLTDRMLEMLPELSDQNQLEVVKASFLMRDANRNYQYFDLADQGENNPILKLYRIGTELNGRLNDGIERFEFQRQMVTAMRQWTPERVKGWLQDLFEAIETIPESKYHERLTAYHWSLVKWQNYDFDNREYFATVLQYVETIPEEELRKDGELLRMVKRITGLKR